MMKHNGNITLVTSLIVLVAFVAGLLVGTLVVAKAYGGTGLTALVSPMTGAFTDGWNAAKKKIAEINPMMNNVSSLSGQIKEINGKEISFTAALINPLDDESLKTRIAVVNNDTKITVWKLKSADQAAKDRTEGQAQVAKAQKDIADLNAQIMVCEQKRTSSSTGPAVVIEESANCKAARAQSIELMKTMSDASLKMEMYQKIDNASLSDIKAGWNITAVALVTNKATSTMMAQYENIVSSQKFTASAIDVREVQALASSIPTAPIKPIATSTKPIATSTVPVQE